MTVAGWAEIVIFVVVLTALTPVLGGYMARVYQGEPVVLSPLLRPLERLSYRILWVAADEEQDWKAYARSVVLFSLASWLVLYLVLRTQGAHPFNPEGFASGPWDLSFNTASSFVSNTSWQFYGGETTLSYFSQMVGITVASFMSCAAGMAVAVAFIRGLARRASERPAVLGNFWVDLTRSLLYILVPLSIIGALFLVFQGSIQNLSQYLTVTGPTHLSQTIAMGPVASYTFGRMIGRTRQGWALYTAMLVLFVAGVGVIYAAEAHGTPAMHAAGLHGANLEGKDQRFGASGSSLFVGTGTASGDGAVDSSVESLTGLGSAVAMANIMTGEVIFGGPGSGLFGVLLLVVIAVFIAGLMVGRTPEYLGKKIGTREMKLAVVGALFVPMLVLIMTAVGSAAKVGRASISSAALSPKGGTTPQAFSETLYAYLSQANNNGSAFAGYTGFVQPTAGNVGSHGIAFADLAGGLVMTFGRFVPILFVLALAGAFAARRVTPSGLGTLRTDTPTFVAFIVAFVIIFALLNFLAALFIGPLAQSLTKHLN